MVVNTTIHADTEIVKMTNNAMKDLMDDLIHDYCKRGNTPERLIVDNSCEMEEYERTTSLMDNVNDIQKTLFHEYQDDTKRKVLLSLVDLMKAFDDRVRILFEEESVLKCPGEIHMIKSVYL